VVLRVSCLVAFLRESVLFFGVPQDVLVFSDVFVSMQPFSDICLDVDVGSEMSEPFVI
jgi:hypothetical protein